VVRVLLAHTNRLELFGLARALAEGRTKVVGEAYAREQVLPLVARTRPDVLLVSAALAEGDGFATLGTLRERYPRTRIIVLQAEGADVRRACGAGVAGYLSTTVDPRHLPALLEAAACGGFCFVPAEEPAPGPLGEPLTERELSVLRGAARGLSNKAIGSELWLSPYTVKSHLHRIYAKLDVANRTEAARYALEHRLVERETTTPA
jgi:DNA-binding NarL/FixJ family response regulator